MIVRSRHVSEIRVLIGWLIGFAAICIVWTLCCTTEYRQDLQPIVVQQASQDNESMRRLADMAELFIGFEYGP